MENSGEIAAAHGRAVLHVCEVLTASGHTVISANTDPSAAPQIFAQSDSGELAFYFVRVGLEAPPPSDVERFRALAAKHAVAAYFAPVTLDPQPHCARLRAL